MHEAPDFATYLGEGAWRRRFDDQWLDAGLRLRAKVGAIGCEVAADGAVRVESLVAGIRCAVWGWRAGGGWEIECECACGGGPWCEHAAALLAAAARRPPAGIQGGGSAGVPAVVGPAADWFAPPPESGLGELSVPPRFHLDVVREPVGSKVLRLLVQALKKVRQTSTMVLARPHVMYGGHKLPLGGRVAQHERVVGAGGRVEFIRRDLAGECAATTALREVGLCNLVGDARFRFLLALEAPPRPGAAPDSGIWFPDPDLGPVDDYWPWFRCRGPELLAAAGWSVAIDPAVGHEVIDLDPEALECRLDESDGWFQLSVGFDVGGRRLDLLPILADLLELGIPDETLGGGLGGESFLHRLPDGSALRLPVVRMRAILANLAALLRPRHPPGGTLPLHPLDAATLGSTTGLPLAPPPQLAALAAGLRDFDGPAAVPLPRGLRATLRVYQLAGFRWLQFLARHDLHGILADDMGLGKTLQTLAHLLAEIESGRSGGRPSLVVAPTSVVPNWRAEAVRFAPALRVLVLDGPRRRGHFSSIPHADLVLTSYALLQRDINHLGAAEFHVAVLDEAQHVKNPEALVARAACRLDARHRLCLSGTPVENHLGELWSLMRFLMPGFLGSEAGFRRRFRVPIERHDDAERRAALQRRISPLVLRRTKDHVAPELPAKTELVHTIDLTTAQKDLYETVRATMDKRVRDAIAARGVDGARFAFLEALLKLRQICCDPRLLGPGHHAAGSAKLDEFAGLLETLVEEGRRILVFSQFTSMLALIESLPLFRHTRFLKLTGATKHRGELVALFQAGAAPVFLISLKAGGTGLILTAADTVVHYDPWWNPAAQCQATDRAHRIGQPNPVFVHKLLCRGTVEERIHLLQQKKSALAEALLEGSARAATPSPEMLAALLAPVDPGFPDCPAVP